MLKNLMEEDNRLDLDAPLLSVRRFASEPDPYPYPTHNHRRPLPFYKSDLKSGPVRNPGVVPFLWERSPGHPIDPTRPAHPPAKPSLPPGRIPPRPVSVRTHRSELKPPEIQEKEEEEEEEEEEEDFSDALETLSRTESHFLNCSEPAAAEASGSFSTDPTVRDFMMGRFLPAAKAMATGSPHPSSKRPPTPARTEDLRAPRDRPPPVSYQQGAYGGMGNCSVDDDDEDCYSEYNHGQLSMKGCGLIPKFCLKSSFCLLNPVPGMKAPPGRRLGPRRMVDGGGERVRAMQHSSLGQEEHEYSWDAVYKHKLTQTNSPKGEDRSKITSESDHLTNGSDSQTADGSSPYRRSNCGGISPYRNEASQSPFHEGKGFLGVPKREEKSPKSDGSECFEKQGDDYWVITPSPGSLLGSGSMSPAAERTVHVDSEHMVETPNSKSSSIDASGNKGTFRSVDEDSELEVESKRIEDSSVQETCHEYALELDLSEIVEPELKERSACDVTDESYGFKHDDAAMPGKVVQVKSDADCVQSLLPPPLPSTPSESWLSRTLPSVSSKNPSAQSFLGIQVHQKKQALSASSNDLKPKATVKPPRVRGQTRFADMLEKPLSPRSEI
ncbi:uncharacterized protein M6B38_351035 [Iris pallida]|uniref:Uncharacterized protein n=1 Tax=Iris pallida TaxID=29817 RepID=A0AAX6GPK0_IRIPA|nr:uncharacterized protein M6B38_351035 [Iris pallida]